MRAIKVAHTLLHLTVPGDRQYSPDQQLANKDTPTSFLPTPLVPNALCPAPLPQPADPPLPESGPLP